MFFTAVYYEPDIFHFPLGQKLWQDFHSLPWFPIENHNRIPELSSRGNQDFPKMKRYLIIGKRKTHRYTPNSKISDYLVPFTSSGCSAMCLYCYLVCHYNKCAYLRLFVNREQMLERLIRTSQKTDSPQTFEIGSNSDLLLENTITENLQWVIPEFAKNGRGLITFPTKFDTVDPLLALDHRGKCIFRMSVNPEYLIRRVELGTSPLSSRIEALNKMAEADYKIGLLIAPVILVDGWEVLYRELIEILADQLTKKAKNMLSIEIILMTYSFVHNAINKDAFPNAIELYQKAQMISGGRGKYRYRKELYNYAQSFFAEELKRALPEASIAYFC